MGTADAAHITDGSLPEGVAAFARTCVVVAGSAVVALVALAFPATPALAHVVATPAQAQAGTETEIGFLVEHGCYGTSTTALAVQLPAGVKGQPQPVPGWQTAVDDASGTIRWSGGSLSDATPATFTVRLTLPPTPGRTLSFQATQTCQQGQIEWRQTPLPGQEPDDLDTPAPALELTATAPAASSAASDLPVAGAETHQNLPAGGVAAGGGGASRPSGSGTRRLLAVLLPVAVAAAATAGGREPRPSRPGPRVHGASRRP